MLIHGFGLNRAMWQWQLPALTPHFSLLTYDLLGHGESAPPAGTPDLAMFSRQLLGLMDRCGIERAAVVGFSIGGMIARRAALDHPDRLSALAILNSPHDRSPAEREAIRKRVRETEADGPAANVEPALERWFTPTFRAEVPETIALVRTWIMRNDPALYPQIYRVLAEGDAELVRGLERIACPTLVMTGEGRSRQHARHGAGHGRVDPRCPARDPAGPQAHGARRSARGGQRAALCLPARRACLEHRPIGRGLRTFPVCMQCGPDGPTSPRPSPPRRGGEGEEAAPLSFPLLLGGGGQGEVGAVRAAVTP